MNVNEYGCKLYDTIFSNIRIIKFPYEDMEIEKILNENCLIIFIGE